ncbi:MAG TPA: alpha/beta hydrolase [Mycobacteriales bacterium]|nr:alpha/beta hydrolase [Mycobacteriales bacterium]
MTSVTVGDLVFDVRVGGPADATPVVLLHGFPQTSLAWQGVWPRLIAAGYRVLAPNQRGYSPGARPEDVSAYAIPCLVADVIGILDALGIERAHVVGHDWGAAIAWQVAARHPDRVRSLVAVSVPHPGAFAAALRSDEDQRRRSRYIQAWQEKGVTEDALLGDGQGSLRAMLAQVPPEHATAYLDLLGQPGVLTKALNYYRALSFEDFAEAGVITVPTMHVWSDQDIALGPTAAHATGEWVTAPYRFEVLTGVSHWVPETAAPALSDLLVEHLGTYPD